MKAYLPHLYFVDPARRSSALLHTLVGFCAIEFFYGICRDALDYVAYNLIPEEVSPFLDPDSAAGLLYDLYSFAVLAIVVAVVVHLTHRRGPRTLFGPGRQVRRDMLRGTIGGVLITLGKIMALIFVMVWARVAYPRLREDQLQRMSWLVLVPLSLLNLAIIAVAKVVA